MDAFMEDFQSKSNDNEEALPVTAAPTEGTKSCRMAIGLSGKVYDEAENVSLQDAFSKFREAKVRERKMMKSFRENASGVRTEEYKDALRKKFLDRARSYFGVPYHEKYRDPDSPKAPLYLDCCGLVRQVVRDLSDDFGFLIARWNQAYQFDMLPKNIRSISL